MADWERSIIFEGVALPGTAIAIDHLGMYDNLPEMSEATCEWLWRFTICVGRKRTDTSENIQRHASEILDLMHRFRERLLLTIPTHYDASFEPNVLDSWMAALRTMQEIAATRPSCSWEAPLRPGDVNYGRSPADIGAEFASRLEKAIERVHEADQPANGG